MINRSSPTNPYPAPPPSFSPLALPLALWVSGLIWAAAFPAPVLVTVSGIACSCLLFLLVFQWVPARWVIGVQAVVLVAFGLFWFSWRCPEPSEQTASLAAFDFPAEIRITRLFSNRSPKEITGLGEIVTAPQAYVSFRGQKLSFFLDFESSGPFPEVGEHLHARGILSPVSVDSEEGFDQYLRSQGVLWRLQRGSAISSRRPPASPMSNLRVKLLRKWKEVLFRKGDDSTDSRRVLGAMILGESRLLPKDWKQIFQGTGTLHFFAISGLHIGILTFLLHRFSKLLRLPRTWSPISVMLLVFLYIYLTGSKPSAVRAGFFVGAFYLGASLLRQPHPTAALVNAAWIILLWDPRQWMQPGFQLSYAVVLGLLLFSRPLADQWTSWLQPNAFTSPTEWSRGFKLFHGSIPRMTQALSISLVATCCSGPLVIAHFEIFAPVGILLNAVLGIFVALALGFGVSGLAFASLSMHSVADGLFLAGEIPIRLMMWAIQEVNQWGGWSHRSYPNPNIGLAFIFLLLLLWTLLHQNERGRTGFLLWSPILPLALILIHIFSATL